LDLRGHGEWGWECQFLYNGELAYGRHWVTRADALAEAEEKRQDLNVTVGEPPTKKPAEWGGLF